MENILIIGAGVVGKATGLSLMERGHSTVFLDIDVEKVNDLKKNNLMAISSYNELRSYLADIVMVCVPNPMDAGGMVQLDYLKESLASLGKQINISTSKNPLIVIRSTVPPTTTTNILIPILENVSGLTAGDDGRFTSLLLENDWKTKYQSTSYVETVSPPTIKGLLKQRLRWFRNSARRASRALTWDGLWVWRKGAALLQMLSTWLNTVMMLLMLYVFVNSVVSLNWFWFGTTWFDILLRIGILSLGLVLTRFVKILFPIRAGNKKKWLWLLLLPWFLFMMFWIKIYSLATMNRQGWLSRKHNGPGGFHTIEIEN